MTIVAVGIGVLSSLAGLVISYLFDVPSGATIVLVQAALFFGLVLASRRR
jgi:zinc transport system permease protein